MSEDDLPAPALTPEELELRKQGLATGKPNLLDGYQRYLRRNPPPIQKDTNDE